MDFFESYHFIYWPRLTKLSVTALNFSTAQLGIGDDY